MAILDNKVKLDEVTHSNEAINRGWDKKFQPLDKSNDCIIGC